MTRVQTPQASSTSNQGATPGWVSFVGSGPGDPGLLTLRGAWDRVRQDPVLKFLVVGVSAYGMSTYSACPPTHPPMSTYP